MTKDVEVCGSNCALSRNAEEKVKNRSFACPDTMCTAKIKVLIRKRGTGGKFIAAGGRTCTLSHVYGLDRMQDAARVAEKKSEAGKRRNPKLARKRSLSPDPSRAGGPAEKVKEPEKHPIIIDADAEAAALVQDPDVLELMGKMATSHTRQLHGDRLEAKGEGVVTRAMAKITAINLDGKWSDPTFKEPRNTTSDVEDTDQEAFLPHYTNETDTFCVCKTDNPQFLFLCLRCERGYHPGCIGEGQLTIAEYGEDMPGREMALKSDFDLFTKEERPGFHCPTCEDAVAAALEKFETSVWEKRDEAMKGEDPEESVVETMLDELVADAIRDIAAPFRRGTKRKAEEDLGGSEVGADGQDGQDSKMEDAVPGTADAGRPRKRTKRNAESQNGGSDDGMDGQDSKMEYVMPSVEDEVPSTEGMRHPRKRMIPKRYRE